VDHVKLDLVLETSENINAQNKNQINDNIQINLFINYEKGN